MSKRVSGALSEGRPIGLPPVLQRPEIPVRERLGLLSWLTVLVLRPSWLWRRELASAVVLGLVGAVGWLVAWRAAGSAAVAWVCAAGASLLLVAVLAAVPESRRWWVRCWRRARLRRRWDKACRFSGLTTPNDRIPRMKGEQWVPVGVVARLKIPKGSVAADVEAASEHLAAMLALREVRVWRDAQRADRAWVELVDADPFSAGVAVPWPERDAAAGSLWRPWPVAVDEMGEQVSVSLPEKNVLIGGEPGAGKSVALSVLLAAAALDTTVHIWGLDAKRVELALWRPVLERVGYQDMDGAISMVEDLIGIMDGRYEDLEAFGLRKVDPGYPLYVLVIDELRFYTAYPDRRKRARFNDLLIDVAARGRAAGIILLCATQKPSVDVVPSSLRDLLAYRWAMRCTTRDASDTILGAGWASLGQSAAEIDPETRGVGLLLAEGRSPVRVRSYYLGDDDIRVIAARGAALRAQGWGSDGHA